MSDGAVTGQASTRGPTAPMSTPCMDASPASIAASNAAGRRIDPVKRRP